MQIWKLALIYRRFLFLTIVLPWVNKWDSLTKKTNDFDQQTACGAPIRCSKYTTLIGSFLPVILQLAETRCPHCPVYTQVTILACSIHPYQKVGSPLSQRKTKFYIIHQTIYDWVIQVIITLSYYMSLTDSNLGPAILYIGLLWEARAFQM